MERWRNTRLAAGSGFVRVDCPRCGETTGISPSMTMRLAGMPLVCCGCYESGNREPLLLPNVLPVPAVS
jgi:predicted RNA-binding Zn-ribbon protein involved in translation (DUF1610 family)